MKKNVLKNFARLSGKHLCQGVFFNIAGLKHFFIEHLRWLLLDFQRKCHGKLESIKNRTERFISQLYNALALLLACLEY